MLEAQRAAMRTALECLLVMRLALGWNEMTVI